jgi:hypothetical protein
MINSDEQDAFRADMHRDLASATAHDLAAVRADHESVADGLDRDRRNRFFSSPHKLGTLERARPTEKRHRPIPPSSASAATMVAAMSSDELALVFSTSAAISARLLAVDARPRGRCSSPCRATTLDGRSLSLHEALDVDLACG